ncbi:MAG: hypothetical protein J5858_01545, partial [Lentisphaeria bacterium]|nr:hypothetical protein [Lentisphaeria bacterium]
MKEELWIWTELLAFDNSSPDLGVQKYLEHIQTIPTGISILSGYDLVLYHEPLEKEIVMPPQVCSRGGHLTNGVRNRQDWTNFQIKALVKQLKEHGIKVLLSVFAAPMNQFFGREFIFENCPENQYAFVGKLNDGRDAGDFFISKMAETLQDYGFDGWHVADNIAACWSILDSPTDHVIRDFAETHRQLNLPDFLYEDQSAPENDDKRLAKLRYLQKNHWQIWNSWMSAAWMNFWEKLVAMVHGLGGIVMVNSPNTKSIFGALQYMNVDYRKLADLGIDYLLVETTSPACELIWHSRKFLHEFDAVLSEMTASMPGVKILIMPSVKDVVENYDALEHAPSLYERDVYVQAAQHILRDGRLKRCADGLIVCLGDCIGYHQWSRLHTLYNRAFEFEAVKTGEIVWLHDPAVFDALHWEHHKYGVWSPAMQIKELRNRSSIDISTIAGFRELSGIDQPIIVPDFFLLPEAKKNMLLSCRLPMILTGHFCHDEIPKNAEALRWAPIGYDYDWYCIFINWEKQNPGIHDISAEPLSEPFDDTVPFNLFRQYYPHMKIPERFWQKVAERIRELLGPLPLENEADGIQALRLYGKDGQEQVHLISWKNYYTVP